MNIDFSYYMAIFWRRFPVFALIVIVATTVGTGVAFLLPAQYRATATLLVESPQIPDALASSTVQTVVNEQLQIIEQRLMTRANLLDVANRLGVFDNVGAMSASAIVNSMRDQTTIRAETGRNEASFLRVTFVGSNAALVSKVTNEFVTLILDENVRMRTGQAGDTLEFFQDEVARLGTQLDAKSSEILKFKSENANSLPENRSFLVDRLASLRDLVRNSEQKIAALEGQKDNAQALFDATGATGSSGKTVSPEEAAVISAQQALNDALSVYSGTHPRVAVLRNRLVQAESRLAELKDGDAAPAETETVETDEPVSSARALLNAQLADLDRQIVELTGLIEASNTEIANVEGWLAQVPANTVTLDGLQRDYNQAQAQYQEASSRLSRAQTGERIELLSKGQRIIVLEQATAPENPFKPNRPVIAVAGLGAGVFVGLALIVLLELLNSSIRRPVEIADKLGITPFAVLPYLVTESEMRWRRTGVVVIVLGFAIGIVLILWAMDNFVMPLDPILERILNKAGYSLAQ